MPSQVQNVLLPPIQKILPPIDKGSEAPAPRTGEDFEHVLKTARKKPEPAKTDSTKGKSKDPKAEAKKETDTKKTLTTKEARKPSTNAATKSIKAGKSAKLPSDHPDDAGAAEDGENAGSQDAAATDPAAQAAIAAQQEATAAAPKAKTPEDTKSDTDHADHAEHDSSASAAVASQVVQPVNRGKDPKQRRESAQEQGASDAHPAAPVAHANEARVASNPVKLPNSPTQTKPADASNSAPSTNENPDPASSESSKKTEHAPLVAPLGLRDEEALAPKPQSAQATRMPTAADASTSSDPASQLAQLIDSSNAPPTDSKPQKAAVDLDPSSRTILEPAIGQAAQTGAATTTKTVDPPPLPPEVQFAQANHDNIVTSVQSQLLPHGGAMQIRLDPPELGALHIMVEMRDGVMTATFQTSNEEATQLLSHSLSQLKHVLESQGLSVERLQVQQAPRSEHAGTGEDSQQQQRGTPDDHAARQEQQRKEMMRRMWRRVSGAGDPIDYLA